MKRRKLLKHLDVYECAILREGAEHTIVYNVRTGQQISVPRHPEIKYGTVRCKELAIPYPRER